MLEARDDDEPGSAAEGAAPPNLPAASGKFTHRALGDGSVISTIVDATDSEDFQKLDLDSGYADTEDWDLAFRRFGILSNGGISGDGGVQLLALPGADFDAISEAPGVEADWSVDTPDGDDDDTLTDNVFSDWYDYDVADHSLTPKDITFLVRSTAGSFFKLRIEDYYDDAGTSGVVTFRWARVASPDVDLPQTDVEPIGGGLDDDDPAGTGGSGGSDEKNPYELVVDARSYDAWAYVSIERGLVTIADEGSSLNWDLAIQRFVFRSNSGTSGSGEGGVKLDTSGLAYPDIGKTSADGFVVDEVLEIEGPTGATETSSCPVLEDWYDYQPDHTLLPHDRNYIVRSADGGGYGKLRILQYVSGQVRIELTPVALGVP